MRGWVGEDSRAQREGGQLFLVHRHLFTVTDLGTNNRMHSSDEVRGSGDVQMSNHVRRLVQPSPLPPSHLAGILPSRPAPARIDSNSQSFHATPLPMHSCPSA